MFDGPNAAEGFFLISGEVSLPVNQSVRGELHRHLASIVYLRELCAESNVACIKCDNCRCLWIKYSKFEVTGNGVFEVAK